MEQKIIKWRAQNWRVTKKKGKLKKKSSSNAETDGTEENYEMKSTKLQRVTKEDRKTQK